MFDLQKGVLSVFGVQLSADTVPGTVEALSDDLVSKKTSKYGHKHFKFLQPIPMAGVDMYLEVIFFAGKKIPKATLYPAIPDSVKDTGNGERAQYCLAASRRWLKSLIREPAESENDSSICYNFGAGYLYAEIQNSRDYGLIGGEIRVRFED